MDKRKGNKKPQSFRVSLKNLPPIHHSISAPFYQDKYEIPRSINEPDSARPSSKQGTKLVAFDHVPRKVDVAGRNFRQNTEVAEDLSLSSTKLIEPISFKRVNEICRSNLAVEDGGKKASAKSQLHEICVANNWKLPVYECCKDEGPSHMKLFTFKVIVEIQEASTTILECFSDAQSKKKMAADHAAEGALWYLRNVGYFHTKKLSKAC